MPQKTVAVGAVVDLFIDLLQLALCEKNGKTQTGDDSRNCQTATATPAKPVVFPFATMP
jgi:hypothetical protein